MTDKLRAAAQQALEALKRLDEWLKLRSGGTGLMPDELNTITALRAALMSGTDGAEQPAEQEPVAWISGGGIRELQETGRTEVFAEKDYECLETTPLYAAPQPANSKPLTLWTEAQHKRAYRNSPELHKDVKSLAAFKRVAKEIAAMYGITGGAK